jgi:hypothetical protein
MMSDREPIVAPIRRRSGRSIRRLAIVYRVLRFAVPVVDAAGLPRTIQSARSVGIIPAR